MQCRPALSIPLRATSRLGIVHTTWPRIGPCAGHVQVGRWWGAGRISESSMIVCYNHNLTAVFKLPGVAGPLQQSHGPCTSVNYHTLSSSSSESNMPPPASAGGAPKAECTAIVSGSASVPVLSNPSTSRSERLENPNPCVRRNGTIQPIRQGQRSYFGRLSRGNICWRQCH